ncbi:6100_t:CDS:2 [Funneliformis mosseae]|uniref:6100_t:CDS:1 n=1 Tax=Funneliformis mosseae TaxID=27381 RepID=A0A9N8V8D1_FUNMO|nr:6100_t:CDS:2 [Funneliformis mosseae]
MEDETQIDKLEKNCSYYDNRLKIYYGDGVKNMILCVWTNGNSDINKFIKDTMYHAKVGEEGFAKVHFATWIDGQSEFRKQDDGSWKKSDPKPMKVALKNASAPFTLDSLPIVDITSKVQIAKHQRVTSTVCDPNKDTIFLFGVTIDIDESAASLVYAFNISVPQLTNTNIRGTQPKRRKASSVVCDGNARMFIFGGTNSEDQLTWSLGSSKNIPPPMELATANLLSNGKIVYLGGYSNVQFNNMSKFTTGTQPSGRAWHSAVLTQDGRIIVYGGVPVSPDEQLSVLVTTEKSLDGVFPRLDLPLVLHLMLGIQLLLLENT